MNLKKIGKVFTSKFVGTGPLSYKKKRIYRAAVSQRLTNTGLEQYFSSGVSRPNKERRDFTKCKARFLSRINMQMTL